MTGRILSPNLASLFLEAGERWGDKPAFSTRRQDGTFRTVSYRELRERSVALATALMELDGKGKGVGAGDHVAILSDNGLEWILADAAVQLCGAADVPRSADVTGDEIAYIVGHADVGVAFVENTEVLARVEAVRDRLPKLRHLILMKGEGETPGLPVGKALLFRDLEIRGAELRFLGDRSVEERVDGVRPGDLYTIIYTSGTTGTPKGVELTHASIVSQIRNLPFALSTRDRALSILPVWHVYERVFEMLSLASGLHTYYSSLRHLGEDLKAVRPTIMASAPRLWEGLHRRILSTVEKASPIRRLLFHAARVSSHGVRRAEAFFTGEQIDLHGRSLVQSMVLWLRHAVTWLLLAIPFRLLDGIVLGKLRSVVGGCLRGTISGGGALPPYVDEFFNDIGIPVMEGYGLTESGTVLAVRTWERLVVGTVGPAFPETEILIVDPVTGARLYPDSSRRDLGRGRRGEIHARGPQLMRGYHKDPEGTDRVLREGWLATGDLGLVTFNDCLKIVGRCKETIVLLGGENVEPLPIESRLLQSHLIDQCIVVGQDRKHLGVLIVPSLAGFAARGIDASSLPVLRERAEVREMLRLEIRRLIGAAAGFKAFERIATFGILDCPFTVGEELTMTFKLKRHVITDRYAREIEALFE